MEPVHLRLAEIGLKVAGQYGFALAGSYAVQAHGTLHRPSDDVDLFTAWERRGEMRDLAGPVWEANGFAFAHPNGKPIHPDFVSRRFRAAIAEAGLPPVRLHDLRHGAATLALAGGADIKTVQAMLRHSTIILTANTYTWVLPQVARQAAEAAAALVPRHR